MITKKLQHQLSMLTLLEKINLVEVILESLEKPDLAVQEKWIEESEKRYDAYKVGKIKALSYQEVLKRLTTKITKGETMAETAFKIHIPEPLLRFGYNAKEIQTRISEWIVLSLFTEGRISSGKAARLLNISRIDFLALLHSRGISYLNYSPEEINEEFEAVKEIEVISSK